MDFEFKRLGEQEGAEQLDNIHSFELTLSRPIGINVEGELTSAPKGLDPIIVLHRK
jgi:hypothetical protein